MKHAVRVDDLQDAQKSNTSQPCLDLGPHACACESAIKCATLTRLRKVCVRREVFCLHTPSRARHSLMSEREICEKIYECARILQSGCHRICKESVAITDLANGDLATECLGVRVAAIVVRMMKRKKVATSRFSSFDSSTPILLAMLHRMVFALFSRFWE